jgi:hypothetical protein
MREIPMLFSTPMVQAIFDRRKTKTRRMKGLEKFNINPDAFTCKNERVEICRFWDESKEQQDPNPLEIYYILNSADGHANKVQCPYGKPGDVLWVRETFAVVDKKSKHFLYKANPEHQSMKWKPSIHMPKAACRLWLKITNVRVERLHDITEDDAIAEGIISRVNSPVNAFSKSFVTYYDYINKAFPSFGTINPKSSFESLWQSINGAESWDANPWVWVVEFELMDKKEGKS